MVSKRNVVVLNGDVGYYNTEGRMEVSRKRSQLVDGNVITPSEPQH